VGASTSISSMFVSNKTYKNRILFYFVLYFLECVNASKQIWMEHLKIIILFYFCFFDHSPDELFVYSL
jgi:hypothetical protein